jgi:hypothetical protein
MPCYLKAAVSWERVLGKEHPWSADGRAMLASALKQLGRTAESAAVKAGNELLLEGADGGAGAAVVAMAAGPL